MHTVNNILLIKKTTQYYKEIGINVNQHMYYVVEFITYDIIYEIYNGNNCIL